MSCPTLPFAQAHVFEYLAPQLADLFWEAVEPLENWTLLDDIGHRGTPWESQPISFPVLPLPPDHSL